MQCQDCTALTHRLSSQLEKKEREREDERQQRRRRTLWRATKDCTTRGWERGSPEAGQRARHGGEQEPALPLHQHNCLGSAFPPAGPAPPTSCDQIRPGKASLNLRRLAGAGDFQQPSPPLRSWLPHSLSRDRRPHGFAGTNRPRGSFL